MELLGRHHVTMVTGDAQGTVDFYADVLGLRLVKTTVNFDAPKAYHLYFGDEQGSLGSILTWFELAGIGPGTAGAGTVHTLELGVATPAALDFWAQRLATHSVATDRAGDTLAFADRDGLRLALVVAPRDRPLRAAHPEVPSEHAILGVAGARAFAGAPRSEGLDRALLSETLGFVETGPAAYALAGFRWAYDAPTQRGIPGAGNVHHIAWHSSDADHAAWQERAAGAGMQVTPIIDRDYFDAIYFRQPQGILFEIATTSPGFAVDEAPEHLGEALRLPARHEPLRAQLEQTLRPIANPRARVSA